MAAAWYGIARTAAMDQAGAWAEIDDGGTAKIVTGVTEIGEGILTVLAQVAAQELGVKPEQITIGDNDTSRSPEAAHAGATRQTYMIGNAVVEACKVAKDKLFTEIAKEWNVKKETIEAHAGEIWANNTNYRISMSEAVKICKKKYGVVPVGSGNYTSHHKVALLFQRDFAVLVEQMGVRTQTQYKQEYLGTLFTADVLFGADELRDGSAVALRVPA